MTNITFIDTELGSGSYEIRDIGAYREPNEEFHSKSLSEFRSFLKGTEFICGHNIFLHDLKAIRSEVEIACPDVKYIDTLFLSPLLFPKKPYHKLLKDDKINPDELSNPFNDAKKARDLFNDEVSEFRKLSGLLKDIYYLLLCRQVHFSGFFLYLGWHSNNQDVIALIRELLKDEICSSAPLEKLIEKHPIELAYCIALINSHDLESIVPRWLTFNRPDLEKVMQSLRSTPCLEGCAYCNKALDPVTGLKEFFQYDSFRKFNGIPLQENAVKAALSNKSLLAIFPTGGGKSLTFQIPALMQGKATKGLTVVISPLQSLMKDQVDNLEKAGIPNAATINGLLDPIDRGKAFERVANGQVHILYISPEALRSPSMERLLLSRSVCRFVIDEAHCFSSWGQDFRVDYMYIGEFIKNYQQKKNLRDRIPVSCFTATAKPQVVEDICQYFNDKLGLTLEKFQSDQSRKNLEYKARRKNEDEKFSALRDILDEHKDEPAIIYVSRTRKSEDIANKLVADGYPACYYHGKLDSRKKTETQNAFIAGEVQIMVATSAFGMGVDKKDVKAVVHYEISDSLENYVQEAGRAGRDEAMQAKCYILFNEEDLNKHFILQNNTRLTQKEINQIWSSIKKLIKTRTSISKSALEIAREAGWDETVNEIETRVTTAIAALEESGYISRQQNYSSVYADSINYKTYEDASQKIDQSTLIVDADKMNAKRIIKSLIASKRRSMVLEEGGESRTDYLSDILGIPHQDVIRLVLLLREEKVLSDAKDLSAFVSKGERLNKTLEIVKTFREIFKYLIALSDHGTVNLNLKEFKALLDAHDSVFQIKDIRTALLFLALRQWMRYRYIDPGKNIARIIWNESKESLEYKINQIHNLAPFIIQYLWSKNQSAESSGQDYTLIHFSILELKEAILQANDITVQSVTCEEIEDVLFYLNKIEALQLDGGFMVLYKRLKLERKEFNNKIQYKADDYRKLQNYYDQRIQQVHIVGEYAKRLIDDYDSAVNFVNDYFTLSYSGFLNKHFPGSRLDEIRLPITPQKFRQIFVDNLSPAQIEIIKDRSRGITVLAGPGSGKTKVLVHKLASVYLLENFKHEQILALTFSRSATSEFKKRLFDLIGNAAFFIDIKTFHSYCFDLLGRKGDIRSSKNVIEETVESIRKGVITTHKITKLILLIDEAQDMNFDEMNLVRELIINNPDMRVILVGDDDQNIYEFRGSSSEYMSKLMNELQFDQKELVQNYRSGKNVVSFTNRYATSIPDRLKKFDSISAVPGSGLVMIHQYKSDNLITPLIEDVCSVSLNGTTSILTPTNEEASIVVGLLKQKRVPARLIQSNEGFALSNLYEVRAFMEMVLDDGVTTISKDTWNDAKKSFNQKFQNWLWTSHVNRLVKTFEELNPKTMYASDFMAYIEESKLSDFVYESSDTVLVSTFHKSKGREFDNVFILLQNGIDEIEKFKRALYVAMTRAKKNLVIHIKGNALNRFADDQVQIIQNNQIFDEPSKIARMVTHKDVTLSFFTGKQEIINQLKTGDPLLVNSDGCTTIDNRFVLRFSSAFDKELKELEKKGYKPVSAKINYLVYWSEDPGKEVLIVLPEMVLHKQGE